MKFVKITFLIVLIMFLFVGCGSKKGTTEVIKSNEVFVATSLEDFSDDFSVSVKASNNLGYDLLKILFDGDNALFSPFSLSTALAMLQNGAVDETKLGILNVMGESEQFGINQRYNALISYLSKTPEKDDEKGLHTLIGNSFWFREEINPKKSFVDTLSKYYGAEIFKVNFRDPKTVDVINKWVEEKTNHLLKDTLSEIDPSALAYLMNTVYFKGSWIKEFEKHATSDKPFYLADGSEKSVSMMYQENYFNYYVEENLQVAAFPYHDGATMYVFLPKNDINEFLNDNSYENILEKIEKTKNGRIERLGVFMPKFEYEVKNDLSTILVKLGMDLSFNPAKADFKEMIELGGQNVYISEVFQNAKIINDEAGTEAAAVTVIGIRATSMPVRPIIFNCNRPFFYVIEDDYTGAALFMGIFSNP